jgi:hypothetical protein
VKCLALLLADLFGVDLCEIGGSRLAVEVGVGARHWIPYLAVYGDV